MTLENAWVGIDVSQATLDVAIHPHGHHLQVSNDNTGITELFAYLQAYSCELVVLESTGGLERLVLTKLSEAEIPAARVNPRRVRDYAKALGVAKTDALDAQVLAKFASVFQPDPQPCPEPAAQALSDLVSRRRQLVEMRVAEKNRLARAGDSVRSSIEKNIEHLQTCITAIDAEILSLSKQSATWQAKRTVLISVPGIGAATCAVCLADLPELGVLSDKKIARLVGVAPMNRDSGQYKGKRMIEGGRGHVRAALYMATLVATRHNPVIREFYQRLLERGKLKKVALTACLRKLVTILNAMVRDMKRWEVQAQTPTP